MQTERYNKILEWILDDRYRIYFHALFWLFVFSDEVLSVLEITELQGYGFSYVLTSFCVYMACIYINLYYLTPKFLLQNKVAYYIFFTIISIFISLEIKFTLTFPLFCFDCENSIWSSPLTMLVRDFIEISLILGIAFGMHIVRRFFRNQKKIQALQTASLESELAFLKQQINPHFLFNSLNNIYVMNRKKPEEASESILLLSDLLRYQLYDCAKDKVYLRQEIEYLKNYLQLDKIRKDKAQMDFEVSGEANGMMVAPFMFIPFVENAVKHGMGLDSASLIQIKFDINPKIVSFSIENAKPMRPYKHAKGGIGLTNVKRRLKLLYPNRHRLTIRNGEKAYKVELSLEVDH